jgi:hypothetical protein
MQLTNIDLKGWDNSYLFSTRNISLRFKAALQIIQKYEDHPECSDQGKLLPVLSNQKMNSYLKEIAIESREGISPSRSHGTVLETLTSHGSSCL